MRNRGFWRVCFSVVLACAATMLGSCSSKEPSSNASGARGGLGASGAAGNVAESGSPSGGAQGLCGNGSVDPGETCDPSSSCPSQCDDGDTCTVDQIQGNANTCNVTCVRTPITACVSGDGCCPSSCSFATDSDCSDGAGGTQGTAGSGTGGAAGGAPDGTSPGGSGGETGGAQSVVCYPAAPGAQTSSLYSVTLDGQPVFVEQLGKFSPEMQVHYAHCSVPTQKTTLVSVKVSENFSNATLSPKSRKLKSTRDGNTLSFDSGPNYLILQVDAKELLFILLDPPEVDPPKPGDPNVVNIADLNVDATGQTLETQTIQSAIDAASGSAKNILYFPPGRYRIGELWLKSNMTLYLAGGALLDGSNSTGDFNTGSGGVNIEGCQHGMIRIYRTSNTKILGRGVIDANGKQIRSQNDTKVNLLKIEESSDVLVDGVLVRDPSFWNTLVYRSDKVTIRNYKMINCRPTTTTWNNTDGVNFDESTNGNLYNAFLYTGDDSMATKLEYTNAGTMNVANIVHEKVVTYSNSVSCKIGTKTLGESIKGVVFRDIDVVKAARPLMIEAFDTALVQDTVFEDIRIEQADSVLIGLVNNVVPEWRNAPNQCIIQGTRFTNISSDVSRSIDLQGKSSSYPIQGVVFENLTIQGKPITSTADANFRINQFVSGITFK